MIIQFCGLSGSGKTSIANAVKRELEPGIKVEIIDGDEYRREVCPDLGFSRDDRHNNIRRLAFIASRFQAQGVLPIICAINPYEEIRQEVKQRYQGVKTVFIDCEMETLLERDTKGLYRKALLPDGHPEKLHHFSGISDPFEAPSDPDLVIKTDRETLDVSASTLMRFIVGNLGR
jgi:adenylylsulfate kinase